MNRSLRRAALSLSALMLTSLVPATPFAATRQTEQNPPRTQLPKLTPEQEIGRLIDAGADAYDMGTGEGYRIALILWQQALTKAQAIKDETLISDSLNNLGAAYGELSQYDKALDYDSRALQMREKLNNQQATAIILNNLGAVYEHLGQYEKALDYHKRALQIREKLNNQRYIAYSLDNLGTVYEDLGKYKDAVDYHKRALQIREKLNNQQDIAASLKNLGDLYAAARQWEEALKYHNKALAIMVKLGNQDDITASLNNIGITYARQKQWDKAEGAYARARTAFETLSKQVGDPTQLADLQQTMSHFYERYAQVVVEQKRPNDALALLEAGRARGLARQMDLNGRNYTRWFNPEDAATFKQRTEERTAANHLLHAATARLETATPDSRAFFQKQHDEYEKKHTEAERQYSQFRDSLFARYPQFRDEQGENPPTPAELMAVACRNPDTLYLTWAIVDSKTTLLFALSDAKRDGLQVFTLPVGEKVLSKQIEAWRVSMGAGNRGVVAASPPNATDEPQQAKALYAALFAPLKKAGMMQPGRYKRIVTVSNGPLLELPFAALLDGQGKRLIETYTLSSTIALGMFKWPENSLDPTTALCCIADPIGKNTASVRRVGFGPLPGARVEGEAVSALFKVKPLEGADAKKAEVLKQMVSAKILHFATHGYFNSKNPLLSGLVLAPEPPESNDDGVLSVGEILQRPLAARLAVLSACETGLGKQAGGEGLLGLVWAFRAAGCPCVVASQWQVDDAATRDLMLAFYGNLQKTGTRKDDAMRSAMLQVMKTKPSPFYWAAFSVIGDTSPL